MTKKLLSPKNDIVFKILFSQNEDLLKDFTASLLNLSENEVRELTVVNPDIPPDTPEHKFNRFDICLRLKTQLLDIEIQRRDELDFRERTLYYWARLYTSELKTGEEYKTLKKSIALNLIDFELFPEQESYHNEIVPCIKGTNDIFTDKFCIHFFELSKYRKILKMNTNLPNSKESMWLQFLNAKTDDELEKLKSFNDPTLNKAIQAISGISDDPKINQIVRMREDAMHEEASAIANAEIRGEERGIKLGEERARKIKEAEINEIVMRLRESGASEEFIAFVLNKNNQNGKK